MPFPNILHCFITTLPYISRCFKYNESIFFYFPRYDTLHDSTFQYSTPHKITRNPNIKEKQEEKIRNDDSQISFVSSSVTHTVALHALPGRIVSGQLGAEKIREHGSRYFPS